MHNVCFPAPMLCFSKIYRQRQRRGEGKEEESQRPPPIAANPAVPMLATDPVALRACGQTVDVQDILGSGKQSRCPGYSTGNVKQFIPHP